MQHIKLIVFDLDGTLADTSPGIYASHRYANQKMRGCVLTDDELSDIIGGPLLDTYIHRFGYSQQEAKQAVRIYREYYAAEGINGAELYSGIDETLCQLKSMGFLTAVATLKEEQLAISILKKLGIDKYLDLIHGMDKSDTLTKADLVRKCADELNCPLQQTVLVGDSKHDAHGAAQAGVDFIGCTYGFGFAAIDDVPENAAGVIGQPKELLALLNNRME